MEPKPPQTTGARTRSAQWLARKHLAVPAVAVYIRIIYVYIVTVVHLTHDNPALSVRCSCVV